MGIYILENELGFRVELCSIGLAIKKINLPWGVSPVVGFENEMDYATNPCYHGVIIGRLTNRVENADLKINHQVFKLDQNEGKHHLHGGFKSLSNVNWEVEKCNNELIGKYLSPDGECGYPGEVNFKTTISLVQNRLTIKYEATSSSISPLSLTHHPYFSFGTDFDELRLNISSNEYLETDKEGIASGKILNVSDFKLKNGIDNCFIYSDSANEIRKNAEIINDKNNTKISIWSDYPAFQVYTSINQLNNVNIPVGAACICVEPQFMTGFTEYAHLEGFYFDGKNKYEKTICYEFDAISN
jgi:aldose 1-epimerase